MRGARTNALSGGMAVAILALIALALAGITIAVSHIVRNAAEGDARDAALRNAETFAAITLERNDYANGRIRTEALRELRHAAAEAPDVDAVTVWGPKRTIRFTTGRTYGGNLELPPAAGVWSSEPVASIDHEGAVRSFLPIRRGDGTGAGDVLEVESNDVSLDATIDSRRGTVLAIIAGLAALLYVLITPAVMRGASALAERRRSRHKALQRAVRQAIENGDIDLDFQPKARLDDGEIVGVEALVRWRHPSRGVRPPLSFLPELEQTPMIIPLTLHILELTLRRQREWAQRGLELEVAVNVPTTALGNEEAVSGIAELIHSYDAARRGVTIEITETAITDGELADPLGRLKEAGARLSIDDFGTGQSSLSRLGGLPFDELKVDRVFVADLDRNGGVVMVKTMLELGHRLGMTVVAEGVEWATTASWLATSGCDVLQGHVLAPPMPASELEKWLEDGAEERVGELLSGPANLLRAAPPLA